LNDCIYISLSYLFVEKRENESKEKADADEVKKEYEELSEEISE